MWAVSLWTVALRVRHTGIAGVARIGYRHTDGSRFPACLVESRIL